MNHTILKVPSNTSLAKSIIDRPKTKLQVEDNSLDFLADMVTGMKSAFLKRVEMLPYPQSEGISAHFNSRLTRSRGRPMLGEYAPFMLCEVLQVSPTRVEEISFPWLMLYEAAMLADDLADSQLDDTPRGIYLLQLTLTEAVLAWRPICDQFPFLWDELGRFQRQAVTAAYAELEGSPCDIAGGADEHFVHGRKNALAKYCGSALSALERKRPLTVTEDCGLDNLCSGVQLLDDITDSWSDLVFSQSNYVANEVRLWLARRRDGAIFPVGGLSVEEVVASLVASGILARVAASVVACFTRGTQFLGLSEDTVTGKFFFSQIALCEMVLEQYAKLCRDHSDGIQVMGRILAQGGHILEKYLITPEGKVLWKEMEACSSNDN